MVAIGGTQLKYCTRISTKVLEKTGTKIETYLWKAPVKGNIYKTKIIRFGEGNRLRSKYGIDTMIDCGGTTANRALISGDTIVLAGSTHPKYKEFKYIGDFNKMFKEMMAKLKQNPVLEKKNYNTDFIYNNRIYNSQDWGINIQ